MSKFFGRTREQNALSEFLSVPGSGLTYLRGRRRIGKSALLSNLAKKEKGVFYFSGSQDLGSRESIKLFVQKWAAFNTQTLLSLLKDSVLSWEYVFETITSEIEQSSREKTIIIFDEIQWLAKQRSGFVGAIKNNWLSWKSTGRIKLIICGSSNKFFCRHSGGEEKTLRGLKTFANIWLKPFSLREVKQYYFPKWTLEEICLVYMMTGGIPYYLENIPYEENFLRSINKCFFTSHSIFLDEIDEVLCVEFNRSSLKRVKTILATLGQSGSTIASISRKTGYSPASISSVVENLLEFNIVYEKNQMFASQKEIRAGSKYFMKDFYLNFFFQILQPLASRIKENSNGLLFPAECIGSKEGYYIPNFSGKAFGLLIRHILEDPCSDKLGILSNLKISDRNYKIGDHWTKDSEVDLVLSHNKDKENRFIECKWIRSANHSLPKLAQELAEKPIVEKKGARASKHLIISQTRPNKHRQISETVSLSYLDDLF